MVPSGWLPSKFVPYTADVVLAGPNKVPVGTPRSQRAFPFSLKATNAVSSELKLFTVFTSPLSLATTVISANEIEVQRGPHEVVISFNSTQL